MKIFTIRKGSFVIVAPDFIVDGVTTSRNERIQASNIRTNHVQHPTPPPPPHPPTGTVVAHDQVQLIRASGPSAIQTDALAIEHAPVVRPCFRIPRTYCAFSHVYITAFNLRLLKLPARM